MAPPPQRPSKAWLMIPAAIIVCVFVTFLAIWQFLTPAERKVQVAYSDFIAEVHAGHVDEIRVRNRDITYRLHVEGGRPAKYAETIGPVPDQAFIESLKPTDPNLPLPKIYFEK